MIRNDRNLQWIVFRIVEDSAQVAFSCVWQEGDNPLPFIFRQLCKLCGCVQGCSGRYADDAMVFCRSRRGADRVRKSITRFIEASLHLRVNKEKTVSAYVGKVKFVNACFSAIEQVNEAQANLLEVAIELAVGGAAQHHIGTGGGGSTSGMPWGEKKKPTCK